MTEGRIASGARLGQYEVTAQIGAGGMGEVYRRFEIYVQPFGRQGTRERISIDGGTQARWRSDGTELYYIAPDGRLMAVPIRPSSNGQPFDAGAPVSLFSVRVETGRLYHQYIVSRDGQRFLVNTVTDASPEVITAIVNWAPPR